MLKLVYNIHTLFAILFEKEKKIYGKIKREISTVIFGDLNAGTTEGPKV